LVSQAIKDQTVPRDLLVHLEQLDSREVKDLLEHQVRAVSKDFRVQPARLDHLDFPVTLDRRETLGQLATLDLLAQLV